MKPQLALRIDKWLEGETLEDGAIVQVRSFSRTGSTPTVQRVAVPVTTDASVHKTIAIEPGTYEVSAMLPSGSLITRIVDVPNTDATIDATLDGGGSPHEWLSWQHWSGNVPERRVAESLKAVSVHPEKVTLFRVPRQPDNVPDVIWQQLSQRLAKLEADAPIDPAQLIPPGTEQQADILHDQHFLSVRMRDGNEDGRAYLAVTMGEQAMLCVMPSPWYGRNMEPALVEAVVSSDDAPDPGEASWSVRTIVRDHVAAGVLSYFASGEQRIARELMRPARDLLYSKRANPLAAAAGAYVLVGKWIEESSHGTTSEDWMQWVRNLADWFPWIPDGKILEAWLALRMRGRDPLVDEARASLLEAERRGIPYYTAGVRRLVDGLMLVSGELKRRKMDDKEIDSALIRARQLAWQIDPTQPFTCVRLWTT